MDLPQGEIGIQDTRRAVRQGLDNIEEFPEIAFVYESLPDVFNPDVDLDEALRDFVRGGNADS